MTAGQGGCIPSIVSVLHSGVGETRVDAARAISSLALSDDLEGGLYALFVYCKFLVDQILQAYCPRTIVCPHCSLCSMIEKWR